uniref:UBC core domain-containing protein n=1 Tax=Lutzomyia longipalpis TaxID=7200 RepID=A0A1B0CI02_LUTLO
MSSSFTSYTTYRTTQLFMQQIHNFPISLLHHPPARTRLKVATSLKIFLPLLPQLQKRLQKELMSLIKEPPPGVRVDPDSISQNLSQWIIHMQGVEGTLYEGEHFELLFKFNNKYPFDSPE